MPVTRRPKFSPWQVETLEGRTLLNASQLARIAAAHPAAVGMLNASVIKTDPGAAAAITSALRGGIGSEWANLIRREVRNPLAVIRAFSTNKATTYTVNGLTFRTPAAQPAFTGRAYDQLLPTAAGAAVFKGNVFELAAVMRGEFRNPETSYYVFALDRGAGARLGPTFASRPGITPDALVTITVGPYGSSPSGTIRDLSDGSIQSINPASIKIQGATLRVFLTTGQVPSRGAPLAQYRFAMWTQTQPGTDIANVAGFAPDSTMARIAVLKNVAVRR